MKNISKTYFILMVALFISCQTNISKSLIHQSDAHPKILFKSVDIFNGIDSVLIPEQDVLVVDGVITKIQDKLDIEMTNLKIIDAKGMTLMPGLIDAHVHLSGSGAVPWENIKADEVYNLSAYLYAGITTVYDLGGLASGISKLSKQVNTGEILGPNIYNTHIPITVKNSHPIPLTEQMLFWPLSSMVNIISPTIADVSEAPSIIKKYLKNNIDYVKISCDQIPPGSPEMSLAQMKALIDEIHKSGKKVFVHIGSPDNAITAIKAGADILAHGIWRGKLSENQADFIASSKIPMIYTIAGFQNVSHIHEGNFQPSKLDKQLVSPKILNPITMTNGNNVHKQEVMNDFFQNVHSMSTHWLANFKLLHDRGVEILIGTDSNLPGTYAGSTYFQEMDILKKYGMSNYEILKAATNLNAHIFIDNPDFGTIEIGKKADILLLKNNPISDLNTLRKPIIIIKNGKIIERE